MTKESSCSIQCLVKLTQGKVYQKDAALMRSSKFVSPWDWLKDDLSVPFLSYPFRLYLINSQQSYKDRLRGKWYCC